MTHVRCSDGPSHVTISGEKAGLAGERLQLSCLVSAHPPPSITWHRLDSDSAQVAIIKYVLELQTIHRFSHSRRMPLLA